MQQPPGYVRCDSNGTPLVCRLKKALYGLRQAPRAWFEKLKQFLISIGFFGSKSNASFIRIQSGSTLYVLVDVDDIIYFLRIEVTRFFGSLHLYQKKYIHDILDRCSLTNAKSVHTPMGSSSTLSKNHGECLKVPTKYRSLIGALQYVVLTRPDTAYAINRVCQFMHNPTTTHMVALKRILRYLCRTLDLRIIFRSSARLSLIGYADANWGLDFDDRQSTSGYFVYFGENPICWCSKKHSIGALLRLLVRSLELQIQSDDTPTMWCDNSSAVAVAANLVLHSKFKHVELDLFFVREKVADGSVLMGEFPACDQVADIFAKSLSLTSFARFQNFLRVLPVRKMDEC
ncbi:hypothetical protein EPI10_001869 [Gossypium australe]|uniref:Reverse transcriptase Ty1/copia-type domain-containing protein n=1 Tax=Gossypium australe TaxID=47621 RepID=A0A5B6VCI7_9ROSI|nr:hypothetical protein EPI10_001869 [Gossypium australe]